MIQTYYQPLFDLIQAHTGLSLDENKRQDVAHVVDSLLAAQDLPDLESLIVMLDDLPLDHAMWRTITRTITVGETYFFRGEPHFDALRDQLLPDLFARRRESGFKRLRIWSAGCATGEEPYSVAMLLHEMLPDLAEWDITLLATDINVDSMDRARRGIYRASSFRNETPESIKKRWFTETADGFELSRVIRDMVQFRPLNLVADDYPSFDSGTMGMDIVICRNVTIYFDADTTREVARRFYQALVDEGWLIVGHSEPLAEIYQPHGFVPRNFKNAIFYQKSKSAAQDMPLPWWTVPAAAPEVKSAPKVAVQTPAPTPSRSLDEVLARIAPSEALTRPSKSLLRPSPPQTPPPAPAEAIPAAVPAAVPAVDTWQQAKIAADRGDWNQAMTLISRAERESPMQPQVHYLRALVQLHTDDSSGALYSLRQAIYCDPDFALAHYSLGDLYEKRRERKLAFRHWRLAEKAIADLEPSHLLLFAEDLTVEMLRGLLAHRISRLPAAIVEDTDVHL